MIDEDECGAIGGMKIGREKQSTQRKPAPAPLWPPQIPHDQTRARTPGRRDGKLKMLVAGFPPRRPGSSPSLASGICGGQSGAGQVFSEYFGFSCQSSFHQILHHHSNPGQVQ
jgi:hypothetical protein